MPLTDRALSQTGIVADHERRLRRMRQPTGGSGFDPNENPVIIGSSATAGGGSTPTNLTGGHTGAVAVGSSANAAALNGVSVGPFSNANAANCVAVGSGVGAGSPSHSTGQRNVALGYNTTAGTFGAAAVSSAVAIGDSAEADADASIAIGYHAYTADDAAISIGSTAVTTGTGGVAVGGNANGGLAPAQYGVALGYYATVDVGSLSSMTGAIAIGYSTVARHDMTTAVGAIANAHHSHATALGANATTTTDNQIMLGSAADFVEIPGDSSTAPNGLVLTDTATGTRYIVQITSGALVLSAAP